MQALFPKKSDISQKYFRCPQTVMVKGFNGEPARLIAEGIENFHVMLVGNDGKTRIKLKVKYIYCYDEEVYLKLKIAFDSGDAEQLTRAWQCAKPIVIP